MMRLMIDNLVNNGSQFPLLYDQHVQGVYKFIYYRTWHRETAEDLTSQTFMKALEHWPSFRAEKASFKTWIYTIARNTVVDHYRTRKEPAPLDEAETVASSQSHARDTDGKLALSSVVKYLATLAPEEREIIVMRVWDELTYEEIAAVTGKSEAAAKMIFSRSLRKLREHSSIVIALLMLISEGINL